jgi:hypothetical protein
MMGNVAGNSRGVEVEEFGLFIYPEGWIYFTKDYNDYQVHCHTPKWIELAWKG